MTVHVWKGEEYIGQVVAHRDHGIAVYAQDSDQGEKVKQLILGGKNQYLQVKAGVENIELEFPGDDWLAVTCLMLLPPRGYRVHVIRDARGTRELL